MNIENIIVCAICLAAIGVVAYYMYTKISDQNEELMKISKRCEEIEMLFTRPPPPDDLKELYNTSGHKPSCESAMCDLEPLNIDINEEELDSIVNEEVSKIEQSKS